MVYSELTQREKDFVPYNKSSTKETAPPHGDVVTCKENLFLKYNSFIFVILNKAYTSMIQKRVYRKRIKKILKKLSNLTRFVRFSKMLVLLNEYKVMNEKCFQSFHF